MPNEHRADPTPPPHHGQGRGGSKKESSSLRVSPALHITVYYSTPNTRTSYRIAAALIQCVCVCVCVFIKLHIRCVCVFFPFILDIKFVRRASRGHTGLLIHLLSAVRALIVLARRIQPFLSPVDRQVEFCVKRLFFSYKKSRLPGSNSRPNVPEGYEAPLSYRGECCQILYRQLQEVQLQKV